MRVSAHTVSRLTTWGVLVLLCVLVGFAIWSAQSAADRLGQLRSAGAVYAGFQQAQVSLHQQAESERDYLLNGGKQDMSTFVRADVAFRASVALVRGQLGHTTDPTDRAFARTVMPAYRRYQQLSQLFFLAVRQGRLRQARRLETQRIDPILTRLERIVDGAATREGQEGDTTLAQIIHSQVALRDLSLFVFPLGLALVLLLWLLRSLAVQRETELAHLARSALIDSITGLGNHRSFQEALEREIGRAQRYGHPLSLALVDLDDFKIINDQHGHSHGDRVLQAVGSLLHSIRTHDLSFRLGGDEFAIVLPHVRHAEAAIAMERLRADAERGLFGATVSIGITELGLAREDAHTLREQADAALYEAKRRGRNAVVSFDSIRESAPIVSTAKINAVRHLLAEQHLTVAFQPIWHLEEQRVLGYEALVRPAPDYNLNGPQEAFDIAEKLGRAPELDAVCRQAILARATEIPDDTLLFINVSPQSLDHAKLDDRTLLDMIQRSGLPPNRMVLEITERSTARVELMVREAQRLRAYGFRLALDDVGAGNAGLEALRRIPTDFIKIDRSVVAEAMSDEGAMAVLAGIVAFARRARTFVIAEGIETAAMLDAICAASTPDSDIDGPIHGAQGYLLGRPAEVIAPAPVPAPTSIA